MKDLGAVPRQGIYDNEGAIGRNRAGRQEFTHAFSVFKGTLGMSGYILRGNFPEVKGALERTHDPGPYVGSRTAVRTSSKTASASLR